MKDLRNEDLVAYLQSMMDDYKEYEEGLGEDDPRVIRKMYAMVGAKELAEAIVGEPINLGRDGKVRIGF